MEAVIHFDAVAGAPMHVALVPMPSGRSRVEEHTHADFYEVVFGVDGAGEQRVGSTRLPMRRGSLTFIRPRDRHSFDVPAEGQLRFINVAFPIATWQVFARLANLDLADDWERRPFPPHVDVPPPEIATVEAEFRRALHAYAEGASTLDLFRVFTTCLPALGDGHRADSPQPQPEWLTELCVAMTDEDNLRAGIGRLQRLAPVSRSHLARTMGRYLGCTPVEFLTERRLVHAAYLLATTADSVTGISVRCGFGSPSYFGQRFRARYGRTPRDYRSSAWRSVPAGGHGRVTNPRGV